MEEQRAGSAERVPVTSAPLVAPSRRGALVVISGEPGAGKTTVCRRMIETARYSGLRVAGLLTECRRPSSGRLVQTVVNLRTGERRRLAEYVGGTEGDPIGRGLAGRLSWQFVNEAVRWGRHELKRCATAEVDLLVIDQLGPLEMVAGSGWSNAVETILTARYDLALVVVNPLVVDKLLGRLAGRDAAVIVVNQEVRNFLPDHLAARVGWGGVADPRLLSVDGPDWLAADLDGTLLDEAGDPRASGVGPALRELADAGAAFCVCTGRPAEYARAAARSLGVERASVIAYGGAETGDLDGTVSDRLPLSAAAVAAVFAAAEESGLAVACHGPRADPLRLVLTGAERTVDRAVAALKRATDSEVRLLRPSAGALAVQDAAATKEGALAGLAARLGFAAGTCVYLGDADDDAAALTWAGLGVAVGDASPAAVAAADLAVPGVEVAPTIARLALARRLRGVG